MKKKVTKTEVVCVSCMVKKRLWWSLFLSICIQYIIKENTPGKYIHRAITFELFF